MSSQHVRNISISQFQTFLELAICSYIRTKGGHEIWTRADLRRPVTFQTHIDPIPEFIVLNNLRTMGYNKKIFFEILQFKKAVVRKPNNIFVLE